MMLRFYFLVLFLVILSLPAVAQHYRNDDGFKLYLKQWSYKAVSDLLNYKTEKFPDNVLTYPEYFTKEGCEGYWETILKYHMLIVAGRKSEYIVEVEGLFKKKVVTNDWDQIDVEKSDDHENAWDVEVPLTLLNYTEKQPLKKKKYRFLAGITVKKMSEDPIRLKIIDWYKVKKTNFIDNDVNATFTRKGKNALLIENFCTDSLDKTF